MINEQLLEQYGRLEPQLGELVCALVEQLSGVLANNKIKVQVVNGRVKTLPSFRHKISRPDKTYTTLWQIMDMVALRVTTYFEESVGEVATLIEKGFLVDYAHSINKGEQQEQPTFGYRSLHYTCSLLPELGKRFSLPADFRFEVQIRTVLQHAWAEIEHDLGYKAQDSLPPAVRRRFSRVASLLEIADQEFSAIKNELARYSERLATTSSVNSSDLTLDRFSLASLIESEQVAATDRLIAQELQKPLGEEIFYPEYLLKMLHLSGLRSSRSVLEALQNNEQKIYQIIRPYFSFAEKSWNLSASSLPLIQRGYALFFLVHLVVLESESLELNKVGRLTRFYRDLDYPLDERKAAQVAGELYATLSKIKPDLK